MVLVDRCAGSEVEGPALCQHDARPSLGPGQPWAQSHSEGGLSRCDGEGG